MASSIAQSGDTFITGFGNYSFTISGVTAGSLLILAIDKQLTADGVLASNAVSDDQGNTWNRRVYRSENNPTTNCEQMIYAAENVAAGDTELTVVYTWASGIGVFGRWLEVSSTGVLSFVSASNVTATATTSSTVDAGDTAPTGSENITVACGASTVNFNNGPGSGFIRFGTGTANGASQFSGAQYQLDSSGTINCEFGFSSGSWNAVAAAWEVAGGGGGSSFVARHPHRRHF